jgi:hypothetical protein
MGPPGALMLTTSSGAVILSALGTFVKHVNMRFDGRSFVPFRLDGTFDLCTARRRGTGL